MTTMRSVQYQLGVSPGETVWTTPTGATARLLAVQVCNTDSSTHQATLTRTSAEQGTTWALWSSGRIPANETLDWPSTTFFLEPGDSLTMYADAGTVLNAFLHLEVYQ